MNQRPSTWYIVVASWPAQIHPRSFVRHATLGDARREALRLAQVCGGEFVVYKAKASAAVTTTTISTVTETGFCR